MLIHILHYYTRDLQGWTQTLSRGSFANPRYGSVATNLFVGVISRNHEN